MFDRTRCFVTFAGLLVLLTVGTGWASARTPIRLANQPALSPDGKTLVFSWQGDLWSVSAEGGDARRLTQDPQYDGEAFFSPDGQQLAFISARNGSRQIFVMPANGGLPEQMTHHTEGYALKGWFPDGRSLLAIGARDHEWRHANRLLKINLRQREADEVLLDVHIEDAQLSPDGSQVLFVREGERWWRKGYTGERSAQIWLYRIEDQSFEELLHEGVDCRWPRWLRDSSGFYFTKGRHQGNALFRYRFAGDAGETSQEKVVDMTDDSIVFPAISANGKTLVFRHLFDFYRWRPDEDLAPQKIDVFDPGDSLVTTDRMRRVLDRADELAFTDDGLEIACISGGDLWVMDTELREPVQVTVTAGHESSPTFTPDGNELWFVSTVDGQVDIWRAKRIDENLGWWENSSFELQQVTNNREVQRLLRFSADGKRLFYVQGLGQLWSRDQESGETRRIHDGFSTPQYDISSDGRWVAYSVEDSDFNNDIWIAAVDGCHPPVNITRHPRNEYEPKFSPDGKRLAFIGQREDDEIDIFYVNLQLGEDQKTSRQRRLEEARQKIQKQRASGKAGRPSSRSEPSKNGKPTAPEGDDAAPAEAAENGSAEKPDDKVSTPTLVHIDFDRIHERLRRITLRGSRERNLFWSHDGKQLLFQTSIDGRSGFYAITFPDELQPKFFSATTGSHPIWTKAAKGVLLNSGGQPAYIDASGKTRTYPFTVYQEFSRSAWFQEGFDTAWRIMRDRWYDPNLGNRNWDAVRRKYREIAAEVPDPVALGQVIELMLGELNGSHMGFTPSYRFPSFPRRQGWDDLTAHLGARFDSQWKGPGWKIKDVIPDSPADRNDSQLLAGEIILEVDGVAVDPAMDPAAVLNGRLSRDIVLRVRSAPAAVAAARDDDQTAEVDGAEDSADKPETDEPSEEPADGESRGQAPAANDSGSTDGVKAASSQGDHRPEETQADVEPPAEPNAADSAEPVASKQPENAAPEEPAERTVTIRPISYAQARQLLYAKWLDDNRQHVEQASQGQLGYLHIRGMDMRSFAEFQRQLFNVGYGREGIIIDVRDNGGGSTTDLLLTALTQPRHAITVPRGGQPGYPHDRLVFASWHKPILVLCNQNSYSNAEIFSHAIKSLGRGKLIGVPTAGGVISTGSAPVLDIGSVRMPFRGWFVASTGEDMEMHGAVPDEIIWPHPADTATGIDRQLDRGIELLMAEVAEELARPKPTLRWATEREP